MMLQLVDGPQCPGCGCADSAVLYTRTRTTTRFDDAGMPVATFEQESERRRCAFCGRAFSVRYDPIEASADGPGIDEGLAAVMYVPGKRPQCPACRSGETKVTSTRKGGTRYHKCKACDHSFRSHERRAGG